ncbi:MAG TPA: DUF4492 domain-containing protein [Bacteroidales bacterium]|jgi:flagellar basal body-associated protein FliL|nr:DUF4492 domain-containing protein [Bacteroidales bacterium]
MAKVKTVKDFFMMYVDGFKTLSKTSKVLWILILVKLFIMFAILRVFFFPNFLNSVASTEEEKAQYVIEKLTSE